MRDQNIADLCKTAMGRIARLRKTAMGKFAMGKTAAGKRFMEAGIMILAGTAVWGIGSRTGSPWPWQEEGAPAPKTAAITAEENTGTQPATAAERETPPAMQAPKGNPSEKAAGEEKKAESEDESEAEAAAEPETEAEAEAEAESGPYVPVIHPDLRPTPGRLNLAFRYAEGKDTSEPSESYAGEAYHRLNQKDSQWISQIYGNSGIPPEEMAVRLGWNGSTEGQTDWNKVNVTFYDGDGAPVSGYSNAKEILSLASVYAYFNGIKSSEDFYSYAEKLWNGSHSYSISMSGVYYCEGACLYAGSEEEKEAENLPPELSLGMESPPSVSETSEPNPAPSASTAAEAGTEAAETAAAQTETETAAAGTATETGAEAAETAAAQTEAETAAAGTAAETGAETAAEESTPLEFGPGAALGSQSGAGESETSPAGEEMTISETVPADPGSLCPGHIDLNIRATIIGLKGDRNLFSIDSTGNAKNRGFGGWYGWNEDRRAYAADINGQDWYEEYGLTASAGSYLSNPLSASEIRYYMSLLPEGTGEPRKKLVLQALRSVGNIPYYWGGKPAAPGMDGNRFGTVVEPDTRGRVLRGLDCSGWIGWVYWTALGWDLPSHSTGGLSEMGTAVSRADLRPGDIIVRTGKDAHVFLFLAWADNGRHTMYLIHETGNATNNVTVGIYDVDWPCNRSIIEDPAG